MTAQLETVHKKLNDVENQQVLLNEKVDLKFEILTDFFKQSLERQDKSIERIAIVAEEARRSNDLLSKDIEYRFAMLNQKEESEEQIEKVENENKELKTKQKIMAVWADPLGKVFITVGSALGLVFVGWVAIKLGVPLDQILK